MNFMYRLVRKALKPFVDDIRMNDYSVFGDPARLKLAPGAVVRNALFNTVSGTVTVEENAFFGQGVSLLTGTHDASLTGPARMEAVPQEGRDIVVRRGAWIAGNATVIGPCVIGENAVVAAGAVVTADVEAGTLVAGVPARPVKRLELKGAAA